MTAACDHCLDLLGVWKDCGEPRHWIPCVCQLDAGEALACAVERMGPYVIPLEVAEALRDFRSSQPKMLPRNPART